MRSEHGEWTVARNGLRKSCATHFRARARISIVTFQIIWLLVELRNGESSSCRRTAFKLSSRSPHINANSPRTRLSLYTPISSVAPSGRAGAVGIASDWPSAAVTWGGSGGADGSVLPDCKRARRVCHG